MELLDQWFLLIMLLVTKISFVPTSLNILLYRHFINNVYRGNPKFNPT